ncbi:MAG TPA: sulfite exporter TauE/SafE family protein [Vicinamibacterales bacterium]|nr:sulfite exporter TauE/SafE family protein [Vicinamibacterales bacterium]
MTYAVVYAVAFLASGLTFFSGFGLGTLLLPAFALFFPVEHAVSMTAVVHFLNGLFKLALVGRHADVRVLLRFAAPAVVASFVGAWLLIRLSGVRPLVTYTIFGHTAEVTPLKVIVGGLLFVFALADVVPRTRDLSFSAKWLPFGGALSGFFGGLSGMQGALRSAFLVKAGLSKEAFIATGVVVAALIDLSRLTVYVPALTASADGIDYVLLAGAVLAAFVGAYLGNRFLKSMTMGGVRLVVAAMLFAVALGLASGALR